ncbi:hypothetical protein [Dictyobacter arantiisoli]|uniref:hypothetical protein n=1 Tax=Dictyobacter arantiisoli TaxID=2014874 RepID=UPI0011ED215B|nr:hypothetical protein [Dictyobacter arantiisoli]
MTRTSWVEICVSDFAQSIIWFEPTLGFRLVARDAMNMLSCLVGKPLFNWQLMMPLTGHPSTHAFSSRGSAAEELRSSCS